MTKKRTNRKERCIEAEQELQRIRTRIAIICYGSTLAEFKKSGKAGIAIFITTDELLDGLEKRLPRSRDKFNEHEPHEWYGEHG